MLVAAPGPAAADHPGCELNDPRPICTGDPEPTEKPPVAVLESQDLVAGGSGEVKPLPLIVESAAFVNGAFTFTVIDQSNNETGFHVYRLSEVGGGRAGTALHLAIRRHGHLGQPRGWVSPA
ncbi:hypothetical protein GA0070618_5441 [Micromonospora echinospora]|uniref:Uncharacterized protein n=2 Tax=Micromonospora echinospora TaxID=1877 RepID=A0A1C4ZLA9_MICEC|nr:hypothetical protein GA0070618_5441 [Micromonospora echinospora]